MTVRRSPDGVVVLEGACPVEEAETLLGLLLEQADATVDWAGCTKMHTAVLQVLLALRPLIRGACQDPFAQKWLAPNLPGGNGNPG